MELSFYFLHLFFCLQRKENRVKLLKGIQTPPSSSDAEVTNRTLTREEQLQEEVISLRMKLQVAYDNQG